MGTNYYAAKNEPTTMAPIHIGKSSAGWLFLFHEQEDLWRDAPIVWHSWDAIRTWLYDNTVAKTNYVIINEYDEIEPYDDFVKLVETKQKDPDCRDNPENFYYGVKNINGYRFREGDFL